MKRILWCSDNPLLPTGYAQVTRNVCSRLKNAGFDMHVLAFQQYSMDIHKAQMDTGWLDYPIHPSIKFGEQYGNQGSVQYWTQQIQPHIVQFLCDAFMIKHFTDKRLDGDKIIKTVDWFKDKTKLYFYFPFDSPDVYGGAKEVLESMDKRIAMSKFGQKLLKKETGLDSHYIPHGVDTTIFRPLPNEILDVLRKNNGFENKFIVGSVFRNQSRKMPTKLIKAFVEFAKDKDDVVLFLHCDPKDPQGHDLIDFINKVGIKDKVKFSGVPSFITGTSLHQVNAMYNMMDVHALSTTGEGFGLPIIESMAVGKPNVITDCTTSKELIEGHGALVKTVEGYGVEGQMNTDRAIIDTNEMAKAFQKYYDNRKLLETHGSKARQFVLQNYNWEKVARAWCELYSFGSVKEY